MNTIRKCDPDKLLCWVFTLGCAIVFVVLVVALVMGLAHAIMNVARGESNRLCFKASEMNQTWARNV